jgi:hypothetical protein
VRRSGGRRGAAAAIRRRAGRTFCVPSRAATVSGQSLAPPFRHQRTCGALLHSGGGTLALGARRRNVVPLLGELEEVLLRVAPYLATHVHEASETGARRVSGGRPTGEPGSQHCSPCSFHAAAARRDAARTRLDHRLGAYMLLDALPVSLVPSVVIRT